MRRAAARSQCANNLKQIALGLHDYAETYVPGRHPPLNELPAGTVFNTELPPEQRLSWYVELLPFIEQDKLYRAFDRKAGWDAADNLSASQVPLKTLMCPDWVREGDPSYLTAYLGVAGLGANAAMLQPGDRKAGVFGYDRRTPLSAITDGTSNTLLILESARDNGSWARGGPSTVRGLEPNDAPYLGAGRPFGGTHFSENTLFGHGKPVACQAVMADGSVRFLSQEVAPDILEALATIAGGETVGGDW